MLWEGNYYGEIDQGQYVLAQLALTVRTSALIVNPAIRLSKDILDYATDISYLGLSLPRTKFRCAFERRGL
jgi:hypothetical protein